MEPKPNKKHHRPVVVDTPIRDAYFQPLPKEPGHKAKIYGEPNWAAKVAAYEALEGMAAWVMMRHKLTPLETINVLQKLSFDLAFELFKTGERDV